MAPCELCGASSHERCMRGRLCPCGSVVSENEIAVQLKVSTRVGCCHALLDIVYDAKQHCLVLQATRPGQTIRVVSAGIIVTTGLQTRMAPKKHSFGVLCSPKNDDTEFVLEFDRFFVSTDMTTGVTTVAASNMFVMILQLHSPTVYDWRAPNTDTISSRWLRLPWNEAVDRRNDSWLPRSITRKVGSTLEYLFSLIFD